LQHSNFTLSRSELKNYEASHNLMILGPLGVGKTTLVRKVCKLLRDTGIPSKGFFTEEVRNGRRRIGFDVVTLDGKRGALARLL